RGYRAKPAGAAAHGRGMVGGSRSRLHLTRPSSAAMKEFDARFFDGETAVAHRVRVQHDADALVIRDADGRELARWPIEGVRTAPLCSPAAAGRKPGWWSTTRMCGSTLLRWCPD